jgi:hypothetical protein
MRWTTQQIRDTWLQECAPCDYGISTTCTCPGGDERAVIEDLVDEVERLQFLLNSRCDCEPAYRCDSCPKRTAAA